MKNSSKIRNGLLVAALALVAAMPSYARNNGDRRCAQGDSAARVARTERAAMLFDGITLTADQKAKIKMLDDKMHEKRMAATADMKKAKADAREARKDMAKDERKAAKRADKAARRDMRKAAREARMAGKADYLSEIKTILTPDQYVKYLENSYKQPRMTAKVKR